MKFLPSDNQLIEAIAKAIGSTATGLDADHDELCDRNCEKYGGTCICIELYYGQAQAAYTVVQAEMKRLSEEFATEIRSIAAKNETLSKQLAAVIRLYDRDASPPPPNPQETER